MEPIQPPIESQAPSPTPQKKSFHTLVRLLYICICIAIVAGAGFYISTISHKRIEKDSVENLSAYERIQKEQEARNRAFKVSVEPINKRQAIGKHTLHIVFFKSPTMSDADLLPLVNKLQDPRDTIFKECDGEKCNNASFNYIKTFLQEEAKRYKRKDFQLDIKLHPLAPLNDLEKIGDFVALWGKDAFGVTKLKDSFAKGLKENNITINKDDLAMFLYFDNTFDYVPDAGERFYEHKKFRSFADPDYGRSYVNVYNFSPSFSGTAVEIITHELLHLFGATDKYLEYSDTDACDERGLGQTTKRPLYPQTTGDIMCLYVERTKGDFKRGHLVDKELVINEITAEEIGWEK